MVKGETLAISVVAAVIQRGDRFLMCQRPSEKQHGGLWEFPGGKVQGAESPFDAIIRELEEELSVRAEPLRMAHTGSIVLAEGLTLSISFIETEIFGQPVMLEHQDIGWFGSEDLLKLDLAPADAEFAARYLNEG